MLSLSDLDLSLFFERKGRTEGEDSGESSLAGSTTQRLPPKMRDVWGTKAKPPGFRITGGFAVSELPYSAALSKRGKRTLDRSRRMSAKGQKEETLLNFDVRPFQLTLPAPNLCVRSGNAGVGFSCLCLWILFTDMYIFLWCLVS